MNHIVNRKSTKSITLHDLDEALWQLINNQAQKAGLSLNQTIKALLRQSLGISEDRRRRYADFSAFSGVWHTKEFKEFEKNTKDFEKINPEDWK